MIVFVLYIYNDCHNVCHFIFLVIFYENELYKRKTSKRNYLNFLREMKIHKVNKKIIKKYYTQFSASMISMEVIRNKSQITNLQKVQR